METFICFRVCPQCLRFHLKLKHCQFQTNIGTLCAMEDLLAQLHESQATWLSSTYCSSFLAKMTQVPNCTGRFVMLTTSAGDSPPLFKFIMLQKFDCCRFNYLWEQWRLKIHEPSLYPDLLKSLIPFIIFFFFFEKKFWQSIYSVCFDETKKGKKGIFLPKYSYW